MGICIIDNCDSFTYNLVQIIERFPKFSYTVFRNDCFEIEELNAFEKILFSPGPGIPSQAGKIIEVIKKYYPSIGIGIAEADESKTITSKGTFGRISKNELLEYYTVANLKDIKFTDVGPVWMAIIGTK